MTTSASRHSTLDESTVPAPSLAPTIAACGENPRRLLPVIAEIGFRHVQLSATQPGMRPRELDRSARRDVLASLRRCGLELAGLDCWIPAEHLTDRAHSDRAVSALLAALELAGDLGRVPVSATVPLEAADAVRDAISRGAGRVETPLATHVVFDERPSLDDAIGFGLDPAQWLAAGRDPLRVPLEVGDRLVSARLADLTRDHARVPIDGDGLLDVLGYRVALVTGGYARPVVLDARTWSDPLAGLRRSLDAWRRGS